jgi:hypothetical protein
MTLNLIPFFSPDDASGSGGDGDFAQDMDVLNSDAEAPAEDLEEPLDEPDKDVTTVGEDIEEDEAPPDEEEDEKEEQEPEPSIPGRPSIKAIKKEFPEVFKKFPVLKSSLFRDAEFSKHFTNPEEAGEAAVKAENYDQLEQSLVAGTPELLMRELHANNPRAFEKVVENWLPQLRQLDEKAYISVTEPIIEELIFLAYKHAERIGDKNLGMSARHLANFVFANGGEIPDIAKKRGAAPNPAELQLQQERQEWATTRFREADGEIFGRVTGSLDRFLRNGLDPSGTMTERMKASIVTDVINEANQLLLKDQSHGRRMSALWKRAHQDSYSGQSKESIVSTYLSGVKPLLRDLRNRIRAEYLGQKRRDNPDEQIARGPQKKRPFEGSSRRVDVRRERATVLDPKKIDYARTSDADILSGKVTLKGR